MIMIITPLSWSSSPHSSSSIWWRGSCLAFSDTALHFTSSSPQQPTTSLKCSSSSRSCSNHRPHHLFIEMRNDIWNCNLSYFWWEFTRSHTQIKFGLDFMLNFICSATLRNIVANDLEIVELSIADIFRFGMMAHWYWYSIYQFAAGIKSWWGDILWISRRSRSTIWSANTKIQLPERALGQIWTFFCQLCYLHVILDSRKGVSWAEPGSAVDCHRLCRKSIQHRFQIHSTPPHCLGRRLLWANLKRTDLKTNNNKLRWWGLWVLQQEREGGGVGYRFEIMCV